VETQVDDSLQSRMIRAARLEAALYDEVKGDPGALPQAIFVVVLSAVAAGIGFGQGDLGRISLGMLFALLGWCFTAYLAHFIGTKVLPEPQTHSVPAELLRTIGFSNSPGIVRMLAVVPELAIFVMLATTVWMICATVIAIRQGLSYQSTARAVVVYVAIQLLLLMLLALIFAAGESPDPVGVP
jgi:hypothetical protein